MPHAAAHKTCILALAIAVFVLFASGCGGGKGEAGDLSNKSSAFAEGDQQRPRTPRNISDRDIYAGDWQGASGSTGAKAAPAPRDPALPPRNDGAAGNDVPQQTQAPQTAAPAGVYSLVLGTFTDANHNSAAQTMISELREIAPSVRGLRVHPTAKGSMVVYGAYPSREDENARRDIERLKAIKFQNRQVFPRVILTYLDLRPLQGELNPNDLRAARHAHPKVNPLYTLDVAMWDDFGSGQMKYEEIRRKAEAYATQLRLLGYDAYFYHDDVNERSLVTVGLFDRTAINSTSGLYTSNITDLIRKSFPQRLVNGEPMFEYQDTYANKRKRDDVRLKPQTPVLVLVPDM